MTFHLFDGGSGGEDIGVGLVEISAISAVSLMVVLSGSTYRLAHAHY